MKTCILIAVLLLAGCGGAQMARVQQAYDRGEISTADYLALTTAIDAQNKANAAAWGLGLLNFGAEMLYINQMSKPETVNVNIR
jgi:hypothetical protein